MNFIQDLNKHEVEKIEKFRKHPVLANIVGLSNIDFEKLLLQRRFLASEFTPSCEKVLVGIENEDAKKIIRWLIREEYPPNTATHREDIVSDLLKIGLEKSHILSSSPTETTMAVISNFKKLLEFENKYFDIKGVVALRHFMEVLPPEEYEIFLKEIERRYGIKPGNSVFYQPHLEHDKKKKSIAECGETHSDKFNPIFQKSIDSEQKLHIAKWAMNEAQRIKTEFYNQFLVQLNF